MPTIGLAISADQTLRLAILHRSSASAKSKTGRVGRTRKRGAQQAGNRRGEINCQDIKQKTRTDIEFDPNPSDVQNTKTIIIQESPPQIEASVRFINQETCSQGIIPAQAQTFWQQWVEAAFPDLDSRAYFLPPVYFNRVPMTRQWTAGQEVLLLYKAPGQAGQSTLSQRNHPAINPSAGGKRVQSPYAQDSDVRDDEAMQRFLFCLQKMSEKNREVSVGLSQLQFGRYLGEPCYAAAGAHLPVADSLPAALSKNKRGDFDVLLIHRQYGIVVCEVKAFGDNVGQLIMSQRDIDKNIRSKLTQAVSQLDKAEAILSHLVFDVTSGLRITKTIVVPNLTVRQVQQAVFGDHKLVEVRISADCHVIRCYSIGLHILPM